MPETEKPPAGCREVTLATAKIINSLLLLEGLFFSYVALYHNTELVERMSEHEAILKKLAVLVEPIQKDDRLDDRQLLWLIAMATIGASAWVNKKIIQSANDSEYK